MHTGYGWEGYGEYVRRCLVRAMHLSAPEVALSILRGALTNYRLPFYLPYVTRLVDSAILILVVMISLTVHELLCSQTNSRTLGQTDTTENNHS